MDESSEVWEAVISLWKEPNNSWRSGSLDQELRDIEKSTIVSALDSCNNNKTHTALRLGIGRTSLLAKMKKLDIC